MIPPPPKVVALGYWEGEMQGQKVSLLCPPGPFLGRVLYRYLSSAHHTQSAQAKTARPAILPGFLSLYSKCHTRQHQHRKELNDSASRESTVPGRRLPGWQRHFSRAPGESNIPPQTSEV